MIHHLAASMIRGSCRAFSRSRSTVSAWGLPVGLVAAVSVGVVGCSNSPGNAHGSAAAKDQWVLPASAGPSAEDAMRGLFSGSAVRDQAEQELIWRCMARQGLTYVKAPVSAQDTAPTMAPLKYGESLADAEQYGYAKFQTSDPPATTGGGTPPMSAAEHAKWQAALLGSPSAPQVTVQQADGEVDTTSSTGCVADARKTLYGSISLDLSSTQLAGNLPIEARQKANADPAMRKLNGSWSACMSAKGEPDLQTPEAAVARGLAGGTTLSIALATVDARCEISIDYAPRRRELEDSYYQAGLNFFEPQITAMLEMNKAALARARTVLSAGAG